ncbi:hypothetical protein [Rhodomicrobium lacus]|uniref:hypothetical protein n=1 Tax=Rhodomicrobium lacus TaxID=2498452 RepID=UPI000F8CF23E|nr:hypothetical protein [Rhodomicrobium lacus]
MLLAMETGRRPHVSEAFVAKRIEQRIGLNAGSDMAFSTALSLGSDSLAANAGGAIEVAAPLDWPTGSVALKSGKDNAIDAAQTVRAAHSRSTRQRCAVVTPRHSRQHIRPRSSA